MKTEHEISVKVMRPEDMPRCEHGAVVCGQCSSMPIVNPEEYRPLVYFHHYGGNSHSGGHGAKS